MKQYRRVPFDLETAKKIQAGEIEGKIVTKYGENARVICWDRLDKTHPIVALVHNKIGGIEESVYYTNEGKVFEDKYYLENYADLHIEVPDNEPQFNSPYSIEQLDKLKEYTEQLMEVNQGVIDDLNSMMQELRKACNLSLKTEFKPFDRVLVREDDGQVWHCDFYSYTDSVHGIHYCIGHCGEQILPYEGNEHLVGTTDNF